MRHDRNTGKGWRQPLLWGCLWLAAWSTPLLAQATPKREPARKAVKAQASATFGAPDPARVDEIATWLPKQPAGPGHAGDGRGAWTELAHSPRMKEVIRRAETIEKEPPPELPDDLYLEFSRTGNRNHYERRLADRRNRMATLILAEALEGTGRFVPAIEKALDACCAEKSWLYPAHDGKLANFKGEVVEIDLASSDTSATLARLDSWLGHALSSDTRTKLRRELNRRTFEPFKGMVEHGKPRMWWLTTTNNWNAVCLANVIMAAMSSIEDRHERAFFVAAAEKYIRNFLDGFTDDGYCSEGLGYWNFGFGHFLMLAETLSQQTGGKLNLLAEPKVREIARFAQRLELAPRVYPAFADCHLDTQPSGWIVAYLNDRLGLGWAEIPAPHSLYAGAASDLPLFGLLAFLPAQARTTPTPAETAVAPRDWFKEAGILICRPPAGRLGALAVALKGGHNAEHHNHNDVGSFVVEVGGRTPLVDPGSEVYTARTFSAHRYDSRVLNSFGHPVPRVAGQLQKEGRAAEGKVLKAEFNIQQDTLVLDLRSCYDVPDLTRLERTFAYSREGTGALEITDEVALRTPQAFETALITFSKWRKTGPQTIQVGEGDSAVEVGIKSEGAGFQIKAEQIKEDLPGKRIPVRLGIALDQPVSSARIHVVIRPASKAVTSALVR